MAQFNMQIDPDIQTKIRVLQRQLGAPSQAAAVRVAIERACAQEAPEKRSDTWWRTYVEGCRAVPRIRRGKVLSEKEFYKDLF